MNDFWQDVRHSLRVFRQNWGFTAAAVAALALGIACNTAVFSVVNTVLLKPPPFPDAERIVFFMNTSSDGPGAAASPAKFQHWRSQSSVVQNAAAFRGGVLNWTGGDVPEQLKSIQSSANFFQLFGASMIQGRGFTAEEDRPNGGLVAVISEGLWTRRFGRDPKTVGRMIQLGGQSHEIIGIVTGRFDFQELAQAPDVWVPFQLEPNTADQGHYFRVAARLKPGVTLAQAKAQLVQSAAEYRRKFPTSLRQTDGFTVEPIREALISNVRPTLLVLAGAVSLVLLIACSNVANLLLARAIGRRREIAVRAALGAGRGRILRQLLTESVVLGVAGAIFGTAFGMVAIRLLLSVNTANLPRLGRDGVLVTLDWRVLLFTLVVTLVTSVLFGLIPALQASRTDLNATLRESSGRSGSGFRRNKARTLLVVTEIALAVVLVVGAALLIRTSLALASVNPGFDTHHILTMRMSVAGDRYRKTAAAEQLILDGLQRISAVPGVVKASAACCIPLEGGYGLPFIVMGRPLNDGPFHGGGGWQTISPGYFDVFGVPIKRGRAFDERDTATSAPVVVINEAMAKRFWPKGDPLNERIWIGKGVMSELATETPRQIVGIVGDFRGNGLDREPGPAMYVPNAQVPDALNALNVRLTPIAWIVRTHGDPLALSPAIQEQLRLASGLPLADIRTMEEVVSRSTSRQRFNMLLMSVFGGAALLLAAIGVYGLMAYSVQQRTQEIGIRLALGADTGDVRKMVVFQGMRFAVLGVIAGTGAAFGLAKLMQAFLFGVEPRDPVVFAAVPVLLVFTALAAVWLPALRATRIDPITALRYE